MTKLRIESVKIVREVDNDPDLSWLGEYSNHDEGYAIDRQERGDAGPGEYRYWNPGPNHVPHDPANWSHVKGEELAKVIAEHGSIAAADAAYVEADYQRCEAYNRGAWCMMGVYAVAEVIVSGTVQRVQSGGLWGIESDSDPSYFAEVAQDELASLRDILAEMGCSKAQLDKALPRKVEAGDIVDR